MTALVSIETATGRFRRYTRYGRDGELRKTHDVQIEPSEWAKVQTGERLMVEPSEIETFRRGGLLIGVVDETLEPCA